MATHIGITSTAVEHLRKYSVSLSTEADGLICTNNESSSSALPKIKYWVSMLIESFHSENQSKENEIDCYAISEMLASILRILDDTDANQLQIQSKATKVTMRHGSPKILQQTTKLRRRLPIRSSTLVETMHESPEICRDALHYDASSLYLSNPDLYHRAKKQKYSCCEDRKISVKQVLNAKTTELSERVYDDIRENKEMKMTALVLDAAVLRRDLYRFLVEVDSMKFRKGIENTKGEEIKSMISKMVSSLLARINTHPNSPSMRLSATMALDYLREFNFNDTGYQMLLDDLLNRIQSSSKSIYVRFYAEIVSECNNYASPSRLLQSLMQIMKVTLRTNKTEETCERRVDKRYLLLQAISQIMVRRKNVLLGLNTDVGGIISSKLYNSYKLMIRRITIFDKASYWIHPNTPKHTQVHIVSILQSLGILSIFCWDESDDEQSETTVKSPPHCQVTEQSPPYSLRAAHDRLGPCRGFDKLLSHSSSYEMRVEKFLQQDSQENISSAFSCINVDLLHDVFSFLGYRSLSRASVTCKSWNCASNDNRLWVTIYFRKYGKTALYEEEHAKGIASLRKCGCFDRFLSLRTPEERLELAKEQSVNLHYNWKFIFTRKYQTEKHTSKTFCRCNVIGCVAHFGRRSVNMHKKMHEKVITSRAMASKALEKLELNVISLRKKNVVADAPIWNPPQHMHSPEEVLVRVFSYLDVKDLLAPVCHMWTTILTESVILWKLLYKSHFGSNQPPPGMPPESWRTCFRAGFKAERSRRRIATHDSLGWATRLCPVVGCCTVLYNQLAYSKHILTHEHKYLMQYMK